MEPTMWKIATEILMLAGPLALCAAFAVHEVRQQIAIVRHDVRK